MNGKQLQFRCLDLLLILKYIHIYTSEDTHKHTHKHTHFTLRNYASSELVGWLCQAYSTSSMTRCLK